jgi:hypothetical protein
VHEIVNHLGIEILEALVRPIPKTGDDYLGMEAAGAKLTH